MKELHAFDVIRMILETQDTCSYKDLNDFKAKYEKEHDNVYVSITKDDVWYGEEYCWDEYYWDEKRQVFIKEESVQCPCCEQIFYKHRHPELYNSVKKFKETLAK